MGTYVIVSVYYFPNSWNTSNTDSIINVPVVLLNPTTKEGIAVLSNYFASIFEDVPPGSYQIIEAFGITTPYSGSGSWKNRIHFDKTVAQLEKDPSMSAVIDSGISIEAEVTNIVLANPNIIYITVEDSELAPQFNDIAVSYQSLNWQQDFFEEGNLITNIGDNGDFGDYEAGTEANNSPNQNPYDFIPSTSPFNYTPIDSSGTSTLNNGEFTISNLVINPMLGSLFTLPDRTTGTEIGRMLLVNGTNSSGVVYRSNDIEAQRGDIFAFSVWGADVNYSVNAEFIVEVIGSSGTTYYSEITTLTPNENYVTWVEVGGLLTVLTTDETLNLNIKVNNIGYDNELAFDNIQFVKLSKEDTTVQFIKRASQTNIRRYEAFDYQFIIQNSSVFEMTQIIIQDEDLTNFRVLSLTTDKGEVSYQQGIITVNDSLPSSENLLITIKVMYTLAGGDGSTILNQAQLTYNLEGMLQPSITAEASVNIPSLGRGVQFI